MAGPGPVVSVWPRMGPTVVPGLATAPRCDECKFITRHNVPSNKGWPDEWWFIRGAADAAVAAGCQGPRDRSSRGPGHHGAVRRYHCSGRRFPHCAARQVTGIIGPNGAGKTTLLNVLCGFVRPQSGTISFDGQQLSRLRPHQLAGLSIARTLQGSQPVRRPDGHRERDGRCDSKGRAGFWSALIGPPWSDRRRAARCGSGRWTALDRMGVADIANDMPSTLAHGPRKRVAMARALAPDPRLLLLDEPASGLNESELPGLGDLIANWPRDHRGGHRAPDGPDDVDLRADLRARLRPGHLLGHARPGPGRSGGDRRLPGQPTGVGRRTDEMRTARSGCDADRRATRPPATAGDR